MSSYDKICETCPYIYRKHLKNTIFDNNLYTPLKLESNGSKILLVFQAPGEEEWKSGKAIFSMIKQGGTAGKRIENSWEREKKVRKDFDITNVVQCFPGKSSTVRDSEPNIMAICVCKERLKKAIEMYKYDKIITFGTIAKDVVDGILNSNLNNITVVNSIHPTGGLCNADLDNLWENI